MLTIQECNKKFNGLINREFNKDNFNFRTTIKGVFIKKHTIRPNSTTYKQNIRSTLSKQCDIINNNIHKQNARLRDIGYMDSDYRVFRPPIIKSEYIHKHYNENIVNISVKSDEILGEITLSNYDNINNIELEIGGLQIDKIYIEDESYKVYQHLYKMNGLPFHILKHGVPVAKYHQLRLKFTMLNGQSLPSFNYNVYTAINPDKKKIYKWWNYFSCKILTKDFRNIFPQVGMFFFIKHTPNNRITHFKLNSTYKLKLSKPQQLYGYDVYLLTSNLKNIKGDFINFSSIDNIQSNFENPIENTTQSVYMCKLNKSIVMNGMYRTKFI
jgi:hypothetical protein